jgi:hypothetical protein
MPPMRIGQKQGGRPPHKTVRLAEFKANSRKLLAPDHPLLRILDRVPDEMDSAELAARIEDWILLLE